MRTRTAAAALSLLSCSSDEVGSRPPGGDAGPKQQPGDVADGPGAPGPDGEQPFVCDPPACEQRRGDAARLLVRGTLIMPRQGICDGQVLLSREQGTILCAGEDCAAHPQAAGATEVCADVILPALVNAHDHAQYNTVGPWPNRDLFEDRDQWSGNGSYRAWRGASDDVRDDSPCEVMKWAEARALTSGTSAIQGTQGDLCIRGMVRDLDEGPGAADMSDYFIETGVFLRWINPRAVAEDLRDGSIAAFVPHAAEGISARALDEYRQMVALGLVGPATAIIHAIAPGARELVWMAEAGASLIWSPRSNVALYGVTTPVPTARNLGIPIAMGPDWTLSGSNDLLEELRCADELNRVYYAGALSDRDLVAMVTANAADAVGAGGRLGRLAAGHLGDVLAIRGDRAAPWRALIEARASDVRLVTIGAVPLYGDLDVMTGLQIEPNPWCEDVDVCGGGKRLCVKSSDAPDYGLDQTLTDVRQILEGAIAKACGDDCWEEAYTLHPLFACEPDPRGPCAFGREGIPGAPGAGDRDGDGVPDGDDLCPDVFDPFPGDLDGDGLGDACDPCPLGPGECDPADLDGDGLDNAEDGCPLAADAGRDRDGDGLDDACDPCPDDGLPEGEAHTLCQVRAVLDPGHPIVETRVSVEGVVTAVRCPGGADDRSNGFWIQDSAARRFGGVFVFTRDLAPPVAAGDRVRVTGEYTEYYALSEVAVEAAADIDVLGSEPAPPPIAIDPDALAGGGPDAEAYEGMLVRVQDVEVTSPNPDGDRDFDEFEVTGGLRVDDEACAATLDNAYPAGTRFSSITGIGHYSFSNYKLLPRSPADLQR